jgi:hypothetical protein
MDGETGGFGRDTESDTGSLFGLLAIRKPLPANSSHSSKHNRIAGTGLPGLAKGIESPIQ